MKESVRISKIEENMKWKKKIEDKTQKELEIKPKKAPKKEKEITIFCFFKQKVGHNKSIDFEEEKNEKQMRQGIIDNGFDIYTAFNSLYNQIIY